MKLTDLRPQFLHWAPETPQEFHYVDAIAEANGIIFRCPKCLAANNGDVVGVHSVICWCPGVPVGIGLVDPGRWNFAGTGYDDLSLIAGSSSVLLLGGCVAHFFVTHGEIRIC